MGNLKFTSDVEKTKAEIKASLERYIPGTYANGYALAKWLREQADEIERGIADVMSLPS